MMRKTRRRILPSLLRLGRRIRTQIFTPSVSEEVDEELAFHVEMRLRQYVRSGMTPEEAAARVAEGFGDVDAVRAICERLARDRDRKTTWTGWRTDFARDVRLALRQARRNPGMAFAVVATLALAVGANTAVFTALNGVVLTALPYDEPDRLVEVRTRYLPPSGFDLPRFPISVPEFVDYRDASSSYEALGIYATGTRTLTGPGVEPTRVPTVFLDRAALEALGVEAEIGRWFSTEEDLPTASIGMIGYDLWVSAFGADPDVVGRTIDLDGAPFTVTGVMPADFSFPNDRYEVFENYGIDPANLGNRAGHGSVGIGRLKSAVTMEQLVAESEGIHAGWEEVFPHNVAHFPIFEPLADNVVGAGVRRALWMLMGAVLLVLFIAAINIANLLMARGEGRVQEVSVRNALGAGRGRIVRQLLTESVTLAFIGALVGLAIGVLGLEALLRIDPDALPRAELIGLDGAVLLFTAAVTLVSVALFGLAPAVQVSRAPAATLRSSGRTSTSGRRHLRRVLVASEVGLSLVVIVGAALIVLSFQRLTDVSPGVQLENRLVFALSPSGADYPDPESITGLYRTVTERLGALPGATSVSAVSHLPLSGTLARWDFLIEGREPPARGEPILSAQWTSVLPGYFETMGIRPSAGRLFGPEDGAGTEPVVVISQGTADAYMAGENPIGLRVGVTAGSMRWARVVGVVPPTRTGSLTSDVIPQIYYLNEQGAEIVSVNRAMFVTVRTAVPPERLMGAARAAVGEIDPRLPVSNLTTMQDVFDQAVARPRLITNLLASFAVLALTLAVVGTYGVVSYSVTTRRREIGIRIALGAKRGNVSRMIVREGTWPALVGVLVAVPAAMAASSLLTGLLFGVSPREPSVFVGVSLALVAAAVLSSYLPARRATRLAPTEALREE